MEYLKKEAPYYLVKDKGWFIKAKVKAKDGTYLNVTGRWYQSKLEAKRDWPRRVREAEERHEKAVAKCTVTTWEGFLDRYRQIRLTEVKGSSWYAIEKMYICRFMNPLFHGRKIDRVFSKEGASQLMQTMVSATTKSGRELAERQKNRGVEEYRKMAEYACDKIACIGLESYQEVRRGLWKIKAATPAVPKPKTALTESQSSQLVDYISSLGNGAEKREDALLTEFLLATFMRIGEACALLVSDFDLERCEVSVSKTVTVSENGSVIEGSTPKTRKSNRVVPISKAMASKIESWISEWGLLPSNYVFFGMRGGGRLDASAFRKRLKAYCKAAGVPEVSPHELRHTGITLARGRLLESDGDMGREAIAEMAGHSLAVEDAVYVHADEETKRRLAKA